MFELHNLYILVLFTFSGFLQKPLGGAWTATTRHMHFKLIFGFFLWTVGRSKENRQAARTGLPSFLCLLMFPWCDDDGIEILIVRELLAWWIICCID